MDDAAIEQAVAVLKRGGLVAFPTETVYGLGADALRPAAVAKIYAAKGRPATHPLIVHVRDIEAARQLAGAWPSAAERLTGYVVGGISPIGQKRALPTFLDESAILHETVFVSAGRRGMDVELAPDDLLAATGAQYAALGV